MKHAYSLSQKGDIYNTTGCRIRASANLTQALFAINKKNFLSDKRVIEAISSFDNLPDGYLDRILESLAQPGSTPANLSRSGEKLEAAWRGLIAIDGGMYQSKF